MRRLHASSGCTLAVTVAVLAGGCALSKEGWGRGRFLVVHEATDLQIRRSTVRVELVTNDRVMNWIGARTPNGQPGLTTFALTVFDDRDGDREPAPGEILVHRETAVETTKVLFSDVRVPAASVTASGSVSLQTRVQVSTAGGTPRTFTFPFTPDP